MTTIEATEAAKARQATDQRPVAVWLFACCGMVAAMMLIGAATRLTESGLSMVEWRPLIGWLPPLSEDEWQRVFDLYRETSQYRLLNFGMSLAEFQTIFWWEYVHRLWGRLIGVVFALPFLWFLLTRRIERRLVPHLVVLFLLGGLQGAIGWWMVTSGFVDRTEVSQYRLAVHLGMAFLILGYLLWVAFDLSQAPRRPSGAPRSLRRLAVLVLAVVFITVLSGALVAGLRAGWVYNTWPLMEGSFAPPELFDLSPWWLNAFENIGAVQFGHRILAYLTTAAILGFWLRSRRFALSPRARLAAACLAAMVPVQVMLGISTLLLAVPIPLAVLHQAGAITLFGLAVWTAHALRG